VDQLLTRLDATNSNKAVFCRIFGVQSLEELPAAKWGDADRFLREKEQKK
jgi:hypothetical protein